MARTLQVFVEPPRTCSYLPDEVASLEHRVMVDVTPQELETLLVRGWRRFGPIYFRPVCSGCDECVSIRIPVHAFRPNRSQRRAQKACASLTWKIAPPIVDKQRLALLARWHAFREDKKGWEPQALDAEEYALQFAFPHPSARELSFWEKDKLVGVSLVDVTVNVWSAVYFFYDPEIADRSPGINNVLLGVELARERQIPYVYLGYRVMGCASMRYKSTFLPHELLRERPALDEEPDWRPASLT
jgi:leucyl-tRNA---protein transferase